MGREKGRNEGARRANARRALLAGLALCCAAGSSAAFGATGAAWWFGAGASRVVVDSLDDASPAPGATTLRAALDRVRSGGTITFARSLSGGTIHLTVVGTEHALLRGETYVNNQFAAFAERDFGAAALYARKNVTIDASALPDGITVAWAGSASTPARVLALFGDLTMNNVTIVGGRSVAAPLDSSDQPYTLARGGGLAVWGTARLTRCTIADNRVEGDLVGSRDRGAFGGGLFADRVLLSDCVVSGNAARGFGAAGGGVYAVGGVSTPGRDSAIVRCALTGNRTVGEHSYGGGVFAGGGGPGRNETLSISDSTVARNAVLDNPDLPEIRMAQYYYRGGGVYMTNGSLRLDRCTIVENAVTGWPAVFSGKPNMGGGGVAATIGNAHVVDRLVVSDSIVAGNTVRGEADDLYSGSLMQFHSAGWNRIGKLDLSQMLVPIPAWMFLARDHWPKEGDRDGVALADAVAVEQAALHPTIVSMGTDEGAHAVLWYPPRAAAAAQIPPGLRIVRYTFAGYAQTEGRDGRFLAAVVAYLRRAHAAELGADFGSQFGDLSGITFKPVSNTWPADPDNAAWIQFWHNLDAAIAGRLGAAPLNDEFWAGFAPASAEAGAPLTVRRGFTWVVPSPIDQRGRRRAGGARSAVGAVEP